MEISKEKVVYHTIKFSETECAELVLVLNRIENGYRVYPTAFTKELLSWLGTRNEEVPSGDR